MKHDHVAFRSLDKKQQERLAQGFCFDCGGQLLAGPEGGCAQNVMCSNCYEEFNFTPWGFMRVGKAGLRAHSIYGMDMNPIAINLWLRLIDRHLPWWRRWF